MVTTSPINPAQQRASRTDGPGIGLTPGIVKTLRRAGLRLRRDRAIACAIFGTGLGLVAAISLAVLSRLTPLALP
nr:hypothetical protein [Chloroflexota bacterium]